MIPAQSVPVEVSDKVSQFVAPKINRPFEWNLEIALYIGHVDLTRPIF